MELPRELLLTILSDFNRNELIQLCQTDQSWNALCKDELLWKNLVVTDFGLHINKSGTWYDTYRTFLRQFNRLVSDLLRYYIPYHPRKIQIVPFGYFGEVKKWSKDEAENLIRSHLLSSEPLAKTSRYIAFILNNLAQSAQIGKLISEFITFWYQN